VIEQWARYWPGVDVAAARLDVERALAWTRVRALAGSLEGDDEWATRLGRTAAALAVS
jgi:hypothetical protein